MKKQFIKMISIVLSIMSIFSVIYSSAIDSPFEKNTNGSEKYRIPAAITTKDGVIMAADARYNHGSDSPQNIDTLLAFSKDGFGEYWYTFPNKFNDCKTGTTAKTSASFIDPQLTVSQDGTIFLICDMFPSNGGYPTAKKGTGFIEVNGKKCLALTANNPTDDILNFEYYVDEFKGDFAEIFKKNGEKTAYSIDKKFNLFKNKKALLCTVINSSESVQQNVFFENSELKVLRTSYLMMKKSTDGGKTFSDPIILNEFIKSDKQRFLGICPGKGVSINYNGKERLLFPVYDDDGRKEHTRIVYSDDGGKTFNITNQVKTTIGINKCSEAQLIDCGNGKIIMYARNSSHYIGVSQSNDGGISWSKMKADMNLRGQANCMVSVIKTSKIIEGKSLVLCSYPGRAGKRENGVIKSGLLNDDGVKWISTYYVNEGFFAYSCLNELPNGDIGFLFEDEPSHISYYCMKINDDGSLNSDDAKQAAPVNNKENFSNKFEKFMYKLNLL